MTRKDFEVVAEIEKAHDQGNSEEGVVAARVLKKHYPRFDMVKFFRYLDKHEKEDAR